MAASKKLIDVGEDVFSLHFRPCTGPTANLQVVGNDPTCYDSFHAGPDPVPAPAWPQTDPRRFIGRAPHRVVSRHIT